MLLLIKNIYSDTFKHGKQKNINYLSNMTMKKEKLISVKVQFYIKDQYESGCIDFEYVKKFVLMVLKKKNSKKNE